MERLPSAASAYRMASRSRPRSVSPGIRVQSMRPGGPASPTGDAGPTVKWVDEKEKAERSAAIAETPAVGVTATSTEQKGKGNPEKWRPRGSGAVWWHDKPSYVGPGKSHRGKGVSKGKFLPRKGGQQLSVLAKSKGKGKRA